MPGKKDHIGTLSISFCKLAEVTWRNDTTGEVRVGNRQTRMGDESQFPTGPSPAPLWREGKAHVSRLKTSGLRGKPQRSKSVPKGRRNRRRWRGLKLHLDHLQGLTQRLCLNTGQREAETVQENETKNGRGPKRPLREDRWRI